jgi:hypothetical protein
MKVLENKETITIGAQLGSLAIPHKKYASGVMMPKSMSGLSNGCSSPSYGSFFA